MVYYTCPVNLQKTASTPRAFTQNRPLSCKQRFYKISKRDYLLIQYVSLLKSVGLHISLLFTFYYYFYYTIGYRHSFKCYQVQSFEFKNSHFTTMRNRKDYNCVNFWCRKFREKINHVPTSNKFKPIQFRATTDMPSTAVGANMRQLHKCSHVVTAAVVGHERLQRGLEPLQLVKSEEVVHYYSCQFRPEKTDRLNKTQPRTISC